MIGVFDSGKGGLTVLEKIKELLPSEDYLYYSDSINCPFGEKTEEELFNICSNIVEFLINNNCKIIVIACNTATTKCMKKLKEKYKDIVFIGTVPAIKVASDNNYKNILVMATPATIDSERTSELINSYKKDNQNIFLAPCTSLADAIENNNINLINKIINDLYLEYKDKEIDSIVLGCTHYPLIKDIIYDKFKCNLIDGSSGVAKEVKRQIEINNINISKNNITKYYDSKKGDFYE